MVQIKFTAPLIKIGGGKGVIIPKAIAELMKMGERYEFAVIKTEDGFEV